MRSLFIAAALMMTSFIAATAQESTVQITTNGPGGNAQYVIKGVPYMTAPANPIILQLGKQPGFIPVAAAELGPNRVIWTGPDGRIYQDSLKLNEVLMGGAPGTGVEKVELVPGNYVTFTRIAGKLVINGDAGGGFGGGLLKFNVDTILASDFYETAPGSGKWGIKLSGGSYFRVNGAPPGGVSVWEFRDITISGDYGEGSLIFIECGNAGAAFTMKSGGTASGAAPAYAAFELNAATNNFSIYDCMVLIRTAGKWVEVSKNF